ncbi:MAG: CopG family transcriptional regulator [Rickettsiaceae bacterium]|nr:CopG family transcriptional regulator [Rickettsiaceae bacterium]
MTLSIRLDKSLESRLNTLSLKTHRPKSFYVKEALEKYLSELEDIYVALDRIMESDREFYTSKETLEILKKNKH